MGWLRRFGAGSFLALLGALGGFVGALFRRRTPSSYVRDEHAPVAEPGETG
jgi:hypothetical protein